MHRLEAFFEARNVHYERVLHAPAWSASRRARLLRRAARQVVKAVLIEAGSTVQLVLLRASARIDWNPLQADLGTACRLATARQRDRVFADAEHGTIPGFGRPYGIGVVMDARLTEEPVLWFPSAEQMVCYRMSTAAYLRMERPAVLTSFAVIEGQPAPFSIREACVESGLRPHATRR